MRDIKFRAWMDYGNHAEMIHNIQNHINGPWAFGYLVDNRVDGVGVKVMQYIGLKDKNGVEIYEGDIVLNSHSTPWRKSDKLHVVEWCNPEFKSVIGGDGDWLQVKPSFKFRPLYSGNVIFSQDEIEVIGNIHENPEFLERE